MTEDHLYFDCGLHLHERNCDMSKGVTIVHWKEGTEVCLVADGVFSKRKITGGKLNFPKDAKQVYAALSYSSEAMLPCVEDALDPRYRGSKRQVKTVLVRFRNTAGLLCGASFDRLTSVGLSEVSSGTKEINISSSHDREGIVCLQQNKRTRLPGRLLPSSWE